MKKILIAFYFSLLTFDFFGQTVTQKLQKAFTAFEKDSQLKHAISSLYVIDANTGQVVFDKNSQIGLAPASTQKIITSVTAFEILGKDYRYKTNFFYKKPADKISGDFLVIKGSGDPTFGSWRYVSTAPYFIYSNLDKNLLKENLSVRKLIYFIIDSSFEKSVIPDGWIWQDIGNYYGAGASAFNWKENQVDIELSSENQVGSSVEVKNYNSLFGARSYDLYNTLTAAAKGTGDNAYYYFGYGNKSQNQPLLKGTIPINEKSFKISIAVADPIDFFINDFSKFERSKKENLWLGDSVNDIRRWVDQLGSSTINPVYTHYSPSLDSIIYWFNKKSINLYGEALIKTFAYEKNGFGSTDSGVVIVKNFWKEKGMDEDELGIVDGSGLSPLNRVTTHAQAEILKYAKTKDWFPYFFNSLPEFNGMKIKSGTIRGVKAFCGYHKAKNGKEYIFSFLVNNYNGSASALVNKMYKVLDILK